jgi:hypothetical protein
VERLARCFFFGAGFGAWRYRFALLRSRGDHSRSVVLLILLRLLPQRNGSAARKCSHADTDRADQKEAYPDHQDWIQEYPHPCGIATQGFCRESKD